MLLLAFDFNSISQHIQDKIKAEFCMLNTCNLTIKMFKSGVKIKWPIMSIVILKFYCICTNE